MAEYIYKRVSSELYRDLVYLFKAAFKYSVDINYYQAKMDTKYLGVSHLGYVAYTLKGEPAAFYGVYPCMTEYKGKLYLAAQSGDTMTHPNHGGKGLFTTLAKMTYELAKQEGILFIFGFPNNNSFPGFIKKLNWTHQDNLNIYTIKVPTLPLAALVKILPFLKPIYNVYQALVMLFYRTNKTMQESSVINYLYGGVYRSQAYFKYKAYYNNYLLNVADRTAWVKVDGALLIGDIEVTEMKDVPHLLSKLKLLAFWLGCTKIVFPVCTGTTWDLVLKQQMQSQKGIYVGYLDLQSGLPLDNFKYVFADSDTF